MAEILEDILLHPLARVSKLYQEDPTIVKDLSIVGEYFKKTLSNDQSKIPLYNNLQLESLPTNGGVVRYRGMVQDMLDPEFYLATYTSTNTSTGEKRNHIGNVHYVHPAPINPIMGGGGGRGGK